MNKLLKLTPSLPLVPVASLVAGPALAQSDGYGWYGSHMMDGYGHGIFGGLAMLVFWGVAITLIVLAIRRLSARGRNANSKALEILKERLARGEIDPEDYEARRKILEG